MLSHLLGKRQDFLDAFTPIGSIWVGKRQDILDAWHQAIPSGAAGAGAPRPGRPGATRPGHGPDTELGGRLSARSDGSSRQCRSCPDTGILELVDYDETMDRDLLRLKRMYDI
jgi:hypothetical protein